MKISEFENTEWGAGMLAIINYIWRCLEDKKI